MKRSFLRICSAMLLLLLVGYTVYAQELRTTGMASCYTASQEGMQTASGELYAGTLYTGCHATLPFGTVVRVTNLRTNTSVLVTINDRFAHKTNRLIDVSSAAAKELRLFDNIAPLVSIEVVQWPTEESNSNEATGTAGSF